MIRHFPKILMILFISFASTISLADGSVTLPDGSVQTTQTLTNGTVQTTVVAPDGSSIVSTPQADGTNLVVSSDPHGNVISSVSMSSSSGG